jgi:4-carboxymuconolactone decarboxylase
MSRLPDLQRNELDSDGQDVWDSIIESRGAHLVGDHGGLIGPFNALVQAPAVGARIAELGRVLRFETSIERRLLELVIITVGSRWKAEFEWWAHARMALDNGVSKSVVEAIGRGEDPPFESEDQQTVHTFARQLAETGRVDELAYRAARELLGDECLVELVSLCGYYTLVSFLLNAFCVPLPIGATPLWGSDSP